MEVKIQNALNWIIPILDNSNVPYQIGGGLATSLYGSGRPVDDIDISVKGDLFSVLFSRVKDYIIAGPKHYKNEKWDCETLSLNYMGQDIDMTNADTLLMSNKARTIWLKNKAIYEKYPDVKMKVSELEVSLMHPRVLLEYKRELDGTHQEDDVAFLNEYIRINEL